MATEDLVDFLSFFSIVAGTVDFFSTHDVQNQSPSGIFVSPSSSRICSVSHLERNVVGEMMRDKNERE